VVSVILFLPQIIAETCSPYLVKARQHSEALFDSRFRLMSAALFWSAVLGAAVISLLARPIIGFLFGAEYLGASAVTAILAWKTVLMALSVSSAHWIIIAGQQRWIAIRNLLGCGANIALNMVLIPRYGAIGASVATLVSFLCASYVAHLLICGYRPLFWHQTASIFRGPGILVGAVRERFRASAR
jgi:O-antigen/teichoic acid export membrane protein